MNCINEGVKNISDIYFIYDIDLVQILSACGKMGYAVKTTWFKTALVG